MRFTLMTFIKVCCFAILTVFMMAGCSKVVDSTSTPTSDDVQEGEVLIPAGSFDMGASYGSPYSLPIHTVITPAFYIDICAVTNAQYKIFCDSTNRSYPPDPAFIDMPEYFTNTLYHYYPVVNVMFDDARAYAAWAGKRLPTEAEWECAAKGIADNRQWPWGDIWTAGNANVGLNNPDGYEYTCPVGAFANGVSPAGCLGMAGNVFEWCEDDWHSNYYHAPDDGSAWVDNPRGTHRVCRGGSWNSDSLNARCADRVFAGVPWGRFNNVGFRCARSP
jgi:formylglycine-generating enzyme